MDETIDVLIEIPRGSRNKYEVDHATGRIRLDRRLFAATTYPTEYGFIPDTLSEDGDPLDVLVLTEDPTFPGCWINARPVGVMWMEDEAGPDAKVICVEPNEPRWKGVNDIDDLPHEILAEIKHFFDIYKDLEPEKFSVTGDFKDKAAAWDEIHASLARHTEAHGDPA
ncbi:MAG TPA: inorganic diphosphatase [Acidimicrobiales bacterium]